MGRSPTREVLHEFIHINDCPVTRCEGGFSYIYSSTMNRFIRHLVSSVQRWQPVVTSPPANQNVRCHAVSCGTSHRVVLPVGARLVHASQWTGTDKRPSQNGDRVSSGGSLKETDESLNTDEGGPGAVEERSRLGDLDFGKTYIPPTSADSLVFAGIPYYELPIIHIKATYNNTHINITDHTGKKSITRTTCGAEGFKNAKKGTTIAAQTVGMAIASKAADRGIKTVRVLVKGIGPGRQESIKGLQMGGLNVVSITDNTPVPHNGCRPRKARRL